MTQQPDDNENVGQDPGISQNVLKKNKSRMILSPRNSDLQQLDDFHEKSQKTETGERFQRLGKIEKIMR
jgi:hypothetical protein